MNRYQQHLAALQAQAGAFDPLAQIDRLQQFSFFSANLANFMPLVDYCQHTHLFQEARFNQQLSHIDQGFFDRELPFGVSGWDGTLAGQLKATPGIICTLHIGSYRLLSCLLATAGVPFVILMSSQASRQQGETFRQLFEQVRYAHDGARLAIVEAESRAGLWQMMQYLRNGYSLLVYADGYGGLPTDRRNLVQVPFFAQHLLVRQGVAFLAAKMKVPLYPMVCLRGQEGDMRVMSEAPLDGKGVEPADWNRLAMTWLFACFQQWIAQAPAQWENWFFMHQQLDLAQLAPVESLLPSINMGGDDSLPLPDRYGLYCAAGTHYLLKKEGYASYPISDTVFNGLWKAWREDEGGRKKRTA